MIFVMSWNLCLLGNLYSDINWDLEVKMVSFDLVDLNSKYWYIIYKIFS